MKVICTTLKSHTQEERKLKVIQSSAVSESGPELSHISGTVLRLMRLQGMGRTMREFRMAPKTPFRNAEDRRRRQELEKETGDVAYRSWNSPSSSRVWWKPREEQGRWESAEGKGKLWQRIGMQSIVAKKRHKLENEVENLRTIRRGWLKVEKEQE